MMKCTKVLAVLLLVMASLGQAFAQSGTIRVTVYDDESGEPMIGANVVVLGTAQGSATDLDGKASLLNLKPGAYDIQVSFITFQSQIITGLEVGENTVNAISVKLKPESLNLSEVVVEAAAVKNTENALMTVQKKSAMLLDAVTADQFSRTGDSDAGAAVKRVVGVTIESGKYVYVRGLGDRYSKSLLNGSDIPSLDPNKNAIQLDLFPSNLLDNLVVYKTFSPELPGDFTGGLVNITTKEFPDRFTLQASASVGLNSQASFADDFLTYNGGTTDWLGYDDGKRSLPAELKGYTQDNFPSPQRPNPNHQEIERVSDAFKTNQFDPVATKQNNINQSYSFSLGNQFNVFGKQLGVIGGLTYNRKFNNFNNGTFAQWRPITESTTDLLHNQQYDLRDNRSEDEVTWGALLNVNLKINNNHKIGVNFIKNQSGSNEARYLEGLWDGKEPIDPQNPDNFYQSRTLSWMERGFESGQLKGEHTLGKFHIDWQSALSSAELNQPDLRFFQSFFDLVNEDTVYQFTNRERPARFFREMNESNWDTRLNLSYAFKMIKDFEAKIKIGGAYTKKDRAYREDQLNYWFGNTIKFNGRSEDLFTDNNLGLNDEGEYTRSFVLLETNLRNNYDAAQTVYAGYAMIETQVAEKLRITTGVRYENTDQELTSLDKSISNGGFESSDFLPAVNAVYNLSDVTNLRFSYAKTLARPNFRETAPLSTFAFFGDNNQNGNPDLKRTLIDNIDLRWEKYPRRGEYIGVSAFYKLLENPIENTFNPNAGGSLREYTYENVPEATLLGLEIEVKKTLDFIAPLLSNFKIGLNATYTYSRVNIEEDELIARRTVNPKADKTRPMYNQSPYVINASLAYENIEKGFSTGLSFNVFGERLKFISADLLDVYEMPRPDLNFTAKKKVTERLSARVRVDNILNSAYKQEITFKGNDYTQSSYTSGVTYSFGLTYLIE